MDSCFVPYDAVERFQPLSQVNELTRPALFCSAGRVVCVIRAGGFYSNVIRGSVTAYRISESKIPARIKNVDNPIRVMSTG